MDTGKQFVNTNYLLTSVVCCKIKQYNNNPTEVIVDNKNVTFVFNTIQDKLDDESFPFVSSLYTLCKHYDPYDVDSERQQPFSLLQKQINALNTIDINDELNKNTIKIQNNNMYQLKNGKVENITADQIKFETAKDLILNTGSLYVYTTPKMLQMHTKTSKHLYINS